MDKRNKLYNRSMKSWLQYNNIEMFSPHIEGKYVVGKGFISTLKNKNLQILISVSTNVYTGKLDDIVSNTTTCYSTIKMNSSDAKSNAYINFGIEDNDEDPKFKVGDHGIISKYFH